MAPSSSSASFFEASSRINVCDLCCLLLCYILVLGSWSSAALRSQPDLRCTVQCATALPGLIAGPRRFPT
eukprot:symbB.v1.2.035751.t1/scaffold4878.1/size33506/1